MTVNDLIKELDLEILVSGDLDRAVTGGYCGDLLSWVMGRAKAGDAWMTVMGNVNAVAVAVLADTACILLVEDASLDEDTRRRAENQEVTILRSSRTAYELAAALEGILHKEE